MKLLLSLILIIFITLQVVKSQKYVNFVGSYESNNCNGRSGLGVGFVFPTSCQPIFDYMSYKFVINQDGESAEFLQYSSNAKCGGKAYSTQTYTNGCDEQPQNALFSPSGEPSDKFSDVSFSNVPNFETNSVVFASFSDNQCNELSNAITYSSGYGYITNVNDNSNITFTCDQNNKPFSTTCDGNGSCTTQSIETSCESSSSTFCSN